jgi:hypothetical protein
MESSSGTFQAQGMAEQTLQFKERTSQLAAQ